MNFSGKRLVVFGAGYVGAEVARQAVLRGVRVTALTRNAERARMLAATGIETVTADLADDGWHAHIEGAADYVLISVGSGGGGLAGYRRSYVEGLRSVLRWAGHGGLRGSPSAESRERKTMATSGPEAVPGRLVYTSSTSVYPQDGGMVVDETAPTNGPAETARVLVEAEKLLLERGREEREGWRVFVLRLAGIYGPGRHHLLDQLRAGAVELAGHGGHRINLVHRDDICAAIWAVFGAPSVITDGIFNVADDGVATRAELVAWLAARLGVPMPRFTGEAGSGRRAVTPDRQIANAKLKHAFGWQLKFPSFREGYAAEIGEIG